MSVLLSFTLRRYPSAIRAAEGRPRWGGARSRFVLPWQGKNVENPPGQNCDDVEVQVAIIEVYRD